MDIAIKRLTNGLWCLLHWRYLIIITLLVACLIRFIYILVVPTVPDNIDSQWYYERARSLATGAGFTYYGKATAYWPVGYPALLSLVFFLCGPSVFAAKMMNIILYGMVIFMTYAIAHHMFGSEQIARISLVLLAFYPNHIAYTAELMSEITFLFFFMVGTFFLIRSGGRVNQLIISGIGFGCATLIKSQVVLLPSIFLLLVIRQWYSNRIAWWHLAKSLLILAMVMACIVLPWTIRNYTISGRLIFVASNSGINLFLGNHPSIRTVFGLPVMPDDLKRSYEQAVMVDEFAADEHMKELAVAYLRSHPFAIVTAMPQKVWFMWSKDVDGSRLNERNLLQADSQIREGLFLFKLWSQFYYGCVILLACLGVYWGCVVSRRQVAVTSFIGIVVALYFTCIAIAFHGESRYHFPAMPWIIIYASVAINHAINKLRADGVS